MEDKYYQKYLKYKKKYLELKGGLFHLTEKEKDENVLRNDAVAYNIQIAYKYKNHIKKMSEQILYYYYTLIYPHSKDLYLDFKYIFPYGRLDWEYKYFGLDAYTLLNNTGIDPLDWIKNIGLDKFLLSLKSFKGKTLTKESVLDFLKSINDYAKIYYDYMNKYRKSSSYQRHDDYIKYYNSFTQKNTTIPYYFKISYSIPSDSKPGVYKYTFVKNNTFIDDVIELDNLNLETLKTKKTTDEIYKEISNIVFNHEKVKKFMEKQKNKEPLVFNAHAFERDK